jgi:hypothetical protein
MGLMRELVGCEDEVCEGRRAGKKAANKRKVGQTNGRTAEQSATSAPEVQRHVGVGGAVLAQRVEQVADLYSFFGWF